MSAASYPELRELDIRCNRNSRRLECDAQPRVIVCGHDADGDRVHIHVAGDRFVRSAHIFDAVADQALVAGLAPHDALVLGIAYAEEKNRSGGI